MQELKKSLKIKIALTIIWGVLTALFSGAIAADSSSFGAFVGAFVFFNLPTLLYWLGFWIWGDGYIFKGLSSLLQKIGFRKNGERGSILRKTLSFLAAIFVLFICMAFVGGLEDAFTGMSDSIGALWNIAGFIVSVILSIKTYKKFAGTEEQKEIIKEHIPLPSNHTNYFLKHWYGEHSLPRSYWINGALLNVIIGVAISAFTYDLSFEDHPQFTAYILIFIWISVSFITIWQAVGIWRSADNYSKHSQKSWGKAAQALTILGMLGFISTIFTTAAPQIKEFWLIGTGHDPLGHYQLRVLRDATELEFSGNIGFGATNKVEEYLSSHPAIELIHLNSTGGRVAEARNLAALIEDKELSTYTSHGCSSACIIPYAAGKERLIEKDAKLGFHQYDFPGVNQVDFYSEYATDREYLISKGISPEFVGRIFNTSPDEMWEPSHTELIEANFITKYPDYDDVAITSMGLSDLDRLDDTLLQIPLYAAIKESDPETYQTIYNSLKTAVERGQSLADVRKVSLPAIIQILYERLPYASGEAILDFTEILVEELSFYKSTNPYKCYSYAMGTKDSINVSDLPQNLIDKELKASAEVISSYSKFNQIPSEDAVSADLEELFIRLAEVYGEDVALIAKETHSVEEQPKHCTVIIAMYEEILKLPPETAVKVLRYMFGQA